MPDPTTIHSTFTLERSFPKPPERVFAALSEKSAKRRWFAEGGTSHEIVDFDSDFRPGGAERLAIRFKEGTPFPGVMLIHEGRFADIVPNRRIVTASTMDLGYRRISASLVTLELLPTESGCDLVCTNQSAFFEGADGPKMREEGWRKLLDRLVADVALQDAPIAN